MFGDRRIVSALAALSLAALTMGATEPAVSVDALDATAVDGALEVTGAVSWSGAVEVAADAAGDTLVPGIGTDFTAGRITQAMGVPLLTFTVDIADAIPQVHAVGEVLQYDWPLTIGGDAIELQAWRTAQGQQPRSTDPFFSVNVCTTNPDTGQGECNGTPVSGSFSETGITWQVPMSVLGAAPGDLAFSGDAPIYVSPGASGLIWFTEGAAADTMTMNAVFEVPGQVDIWLADAAGTTVVGGGAVAGDGGAFATSLDTADLPAGDYTLEARTCYGALGTCATASTPVTLP